jgi:hypothetical protein
MDTLANEATRRSPGARRPTCARRASPSARQRPRWLPAPDAAGPPRILRQMDEVRTIRASPPGISVHWRYRSRVRGNGAGRRSARRNGRGGFTALPTHGLRPTNASSRQPPRVRRARQRQRRAERPTHRAQTPDAIFVERQIFCRRVGGERLMQTPAASATRSASARRGLVRRVGRIRGMPMMISDVTT